MKYLKLFFYLASVLTISTNIFFYPGFLENKIGINAILFGLIFIILGSISLFLKDKGTENLLIKKVLFLNRYALLPLSLLSLLFFTFLELTNYPNFVFSKFKIYHFDLLLIFILSFFAEVFLKEKKEFVKKYKTYIFLFSVILIFAFIMMLTWPNDFFAIISKEDGIFENLQFLFYLTSGILTLITVKKLFKLNKFAAISYFFLGLLFIAVAFEEISWAQRLTNHSIPLIEQSNYKGETNIHNQNFVGGYLKIAYIITGFYGTFSYFLLRKIGGWIKFFSPSFEFFLYFLTLSVVYLHVIPIDRIYQEEFAETLFSLGFLLFILKNLLTLKFKKSPNPSQLEIPN